MKLFYCSHLSRFYLICYFVFLLAFFAFCHTVAHVTDDVTAEVLAEAISTFADLSEILLFLLFSFFVSLYYFRLFVSFVFILSRSLVLGSLG